MEKKVRWWRQATRKEEEEDFELEEKEKKVNFED